MLFYMDKMSANNLQVVYKISLIKIVLQNMIRYLN